MKTSDRRYCLVTPCRNEAEYAARSIDSVLRQSVRPALWVIVDDGSTDETPQILAEYARRHSFIRVIRRTDRGHRYVGAGVIEAFNEGLATIDIEDFAYLCKLDLDLILPSRYFEYLMERMEANARVGTCSGKPYYRAASGKYVSEKCGDENSIGASKFYRRECFQEIGGFVSGIMWDGIDCHRCRMLGWIAASWDDSETRFEHLRPMGSSHKSMWNGRKRHGQGQYFMGYSPAFVFASALYRSGSRPWLVGSTAILWGYFTSLISRAPRYQNREFVKSLRNYQWRSLVVGKRCALTRIHAAHEHMWRSRHSTNGETPLDVEPHQSSLSASVADG